MPLFVKAGSIVPMGPYLQYASEKPADPLEIRIYPGADASFVLYEDENDTYNYEQGKYATIGMHWTEGDQTLTVEDRKGSFPGMLQNRTFHVVWVDSGNGSGIEPAKKVKTVQYEGKEVKIRR
jgi:alpha-D-xyloside xylohydrolase